MPPPNRLSLTDNRDQYNWDTDSLSLSNLRVNACKRCVCSACFLNVILSAALLIAAGIIVYLFLKPSLSKYGQAVSPEVKTFCGLVRGRQRENIREFLGIPYALPPIGENRFRRPVELDTSELCSQSWMAKNTTTDDMRVLDTMQYKSPCMQLTPVNDQIVGSEDCLYLNVFIPPGNTENNNKLKPVVVVMNGLLFAYGATNGIPVSQGQQPHPITIKSVDAIHVTFNYRVGPLGFLTHPIIKQANLGVYDQLAVLRWVRTNIAAFGGDSARVTLFGYGTGATCALALHYSDLGQNLFDRLWISAPAMGKPWINISAAVEKSRYHFRCDPSMHDKCAEGYITQPEDVVRLWKWKMMKNWFRRRLFSLPNLSRNKSSDLSVKSFDPFDGLLVTDDILIKSINWHKPVYKMPIIMGQTSHETALFITPETAPLWDRTAFIQYVDRQLYVQNQSIQMENFTSQSQISCGNEEQTERNLTQSTNEFDSELYLSSLVTDLRFTCPSRKILDHIIQGGYSRIYQYYSIDVHNRFDPYALTSFASLAFHGWDAMLYMRGYLTHFDYRRSIMMSHNHTSTQTVTEAMSDQFNRAMHQFSRTGRVLEWIATHRGTDRMNVIHNGLSCIRERFFQHKCEQLDRLTDNPLDYVWNI